MEPIACMLLHIILHVIVFKSLRKDYIGIIGIILITVSKGCSEGLITELLNII